MAAAHSRLIRSVSSAVGGTRVGPKPLSGKMALRAACSAAGSQRASSSVAWMWKDSSLHGRVC
jgi:hypothetical protein